MPLPTNFPTETLLRRAIAIAVEAKADGAAPFGALIANRDGHIVAEAPNTTRVEGGISRHAEINAIERAMAVHGGKLTDHILLTSAEPCQMCAGAVFWAGLSTVIYAVSIPKLIELNGPQSQIDLACRTILERAPLPIEVIGPMLEEEGAVVFYR